MTNYIIRSILKAFLNMLLVMTIVFFFIRMGSSDPAQIMLGENVSAEKIEQLRHHLGLDIPLHQQYLNFSHDLVRFDFGSSYFSGQNVLGMLGDVLPYTLELVVAAVVVGIILGIPTGILASLKPGGAVDHIIRLITMAGISIPGFILGLFLIALFSLELSWLPALGGTQSPLVSERIRYLILPSLSTGIGMMAGVARLTRASLIDVLSKNYIETARAKGLKEKVVILKHAFRNALLPVITYMGVNISALLGSSVIVEIVFTRPGVGRLIIDGIKNADYPVVQIVLMLYAGAVVLINLLVDITYCFAEPRIVYT
jgi:glutathione transport system permease protein